MPNTSASLDLNLLPMVRQEGKDQPEWPGLYASTPPRGAARGRDADQLVLYLTVTGTAPLPAEQLTQLLPRLAQAYYRTPGTVTSALKSVVEELNRYLLERNLRASNTGRQGVGQLTQVVLRGELLYLAHSGPVYSYLLNASGTELMYDESGAGRGLGLSRTAAVRYFQSSLQSGDFLLLSHQPAPGWNTETVRSSSGQGIEGLRRRLLSAAHIDYHAVLVQVLGGAGKLRLLRLKAPFQDMARPAAGETLPPAAPEEFDNAVLQPAPSQADLPGEPLLAQASPGEEPSPVAAPASISEPSLEVPAQHPDFLAEEDIPGEQSVPDLARLESSESDTPATVPAPARLKVPPAAVVPPAAPARRPLPRPAAPRWNLRKTLQPLLRVIAAIFQATGRTLGQLLRAVGALFKRLLPDETLLNISPSTMIFLAVLVPMVVSIVGGLMYVQRGQSLQHDQYYQKALVAAERAAAAESPAEQRTSWKLTLEMLAEAEFYKTTPESDALRLRAQSALDALDGAERLNYQPAIVGGLDASKRITGLAAPPGELYALDGLSGSVLRAVLTGSAFELDRQFTCGPVQGEPSVGPLIDMAPLPRGNELNAAILAMDANGGLLYCIPGQQPLIAQLAPPPMNFRSPKAFTLDAGDLYLLDPGNNAVWIYRNMDFTQPPRLFFGDQVPFMQDVVDLAVYNDDLYLLHSDGRQTLCSYNSFGVSSGRCEDPLIYTDGRPGRENGPVIRDSLFDQLLFAPPPDPSLYLLDPVNQAVFHFSLRLNFQRQYRSALALSENSATAFTLNSDRLLFLAVQNEIFFAVLP